MNVAQIEEVTRLNQVIENGLHELKVMDEVETIHEGRDVDGIVTEIYESQQSVRIRLRILRRNVVKKANEVWYVGHLPKD